MGAEYPGDFAMLLKRFRSDAGLTQEELAEQAQLSPKAVSSLERGVRRRPHRVTVALLADALALVPEDRSLLEQAARSDRSMATDASPVRPVELPTGAYLGAFPVDPIVARGEELTGLIAAIRDVKANSGRTVMLAGEPGVGKTRLAQESHLLLRDQGFVTGIGRCYEPRASVPYFPFLDALTGLFAGSPEDVRARASSHRPYLQFVLPDGMGSSPPPADGHDEQVLVFRAVAGFLCELAAHSPVAILLDDLQWADGSSLQLLHHLARETRAHRVFLLATYRRGDAQTRSALGALLRDLAREGLEQRVDVGRLDREANQQLVSDLLGDGALSEELAEFIFRRSEGNPYFARQLLAAVIESGDRITTGDRIGVPDSVRALVDQRVARLSAESRQALCEATVLGPAFAFDDLHSMTGYSEESLERALEAACSAGVLMETDSGFSFDHGLTQQSLYQELPAHRRKRLHGRAGEVIAELPERARRGRLAELAWHFVQAADPVNGLKWSLEAGDSAWSISALSEAEQQYRAAVGLAEEIDDKHACARSYEGLGRLMNVIGEADEARRRLEQADELYAGLDDENGRGRCAVELAGLYARVEGAGDSLRVVQDAIERLTSTETASHSINESPLAELHAVLAEQLWPTGKRIEALEATRAASSLARESKQARIQGWADMQEALMLETLGHRPEALTAAEDALKTVTAANADDLLWYSLSVLTQMRTVRGDLSGARELIERALDIGIKRGDPQYQAASLADLGRYLTWSGDWSGADRAFSGAAALVDAGDPIGRFISISRCRLRLWKGDHDGLRETIEELMRAAEATGNLDRQTSAVLLLAEFQTGSGNADGPMTLLLELSERPGFAKDDPAFGVALSQAYLALGKLDEAGEVVNRYAQAARSAGLLLPLVDLERVRAGILVATDRAAEAAGAAAESLRLAVGMRAPYKEAQALLALSAVQHALNRSAEGRDSKDAASRIFQTLGVAEDVARVLASSS